MVATDRACSLVAHYAPVFPCLGGASVSATRAASERRERERERERERNFREKSIGYSMQMRSKFRAPVLRTFCKR